MKDTQFMSAAEKERVLKQWERFLKGGLKQEQFDKALYQHLINHCSFIAHYDRAGFYSTYFETGDGIRDFLSQFDERGADFNGIPNSVEYGMTYWATGDYADINQAMIKVASKYIPGLLSQAKQSQEDADIAEAKRLLARHGIKLEATVASGVNVRELVKV